MLSSQVQPAILKRSYSLRVSAEFYQFHIADLWAERDFCWDERTLVELFDLDPGSIGIGTNCEGLVSVEIQIWSSEPAVVSESWDHIIECGIEVPSGVLVVVACCGHPEDFFEVPLGAGKYTARVSYGNQYECGDEDPTCTGEYLIMLWPSQDNVTRVIKSHVDFFAPTVS